MVTQSKLGKVKTIYKQRFKRLAVKPGRPPPMAIRVKDSCEGSGLSTRKSSQGSCPFFVIQNSVVALIISWLSYLHYGLAKSGIG